LSENIGYVYVKLGGSFITFKDKPFSVNYVALDKIVEILQRINSTKPLILGNGGGSFAHTVVKLYEDPLLKIIMCQSSTRRLNSIVVDHLVNNGVKACSIQTSAIMYEIEDGLIVNPTPVKLALTNKFYPVLYGECIFSTKTIYRVISTEEVFTNLSKFFKPSHIVLITDVDGIYTCDPRKCSDAELIRLINRENVDSVLGKLVDQRSRDATGSVYGKVLSMTKLSRELGVKVYIVSGYRVNDVVKAINGEDDVYGTIIDLRERSHNVYC